MTKNLLTRIKYTPELNIQYLNVFIKWGASANNQIYLSGA